MASKRAENIDNKKLSIRKPSEWGIPEELKTDKDYWGMPLAERAYFRILYSGFAFLIVGSILDTLGLPLIAQFFLAGLIALCVLVFRMAYPNGFTMVLNEINESIQEGYKQQAELLMQRQKDDKSKK